MRKFAFAAMLLGVSLCLLPGSAPAEEPAKPVVLSPGQEVPAIELPVFNSDKPFRTMDYKGKKGLVIAFVQSACASCRSELQYMNTLLGASDKYEVVAINVDLRSAREAWKEAMGQIVEMEGYKMRFALDPKYTTPPIFQVLATPSTAVVGKDGKLIGIETGYGPKTNASIAKMIEKI